MKIEIKMRRLYLIIGIIITTVSLSAQTTISGTIRSTTKEPLAGASIAIEGSYDGATSAQDGSFSFSTSETGKKKFVVTMLGYKDLEQIINLESGKIELNFVLREAATELKLVTITAGSFEASDKKRGTLLKPLDIVTTAGAHADMVAALKTLPGVQQANDANGLFVRGGTGTESKVFIDGMGIANPFYSAVPDIGQRARFSPLLFKGTIFSAGGYSAQYGDALSSALILETRDLPSRTESNFLISSAQLSATRYHLFKSGRESVGITVNYNNLSPYYNLVPPRVHYTKPFESINSDFNWRKKIGSNGMLKVFGYLNKSEVGLSNSSITYSGFNDLFNLKNKNALAIASFQNNLFPGWKIFIGGSYTANQDDINTSVSGKDTVLNTFSPIIQNNTFQSRVTLTGKLFGNSKIYIGSEYQFITDKIFAKDSIPHLKLVDHILSPYVETDIYITAKFVARLGIRYDYTSLLDHGNISPRVSIAYKLKDNRQFSFAYGDFYQRQDARYLFRNDLLDYSKATHYILNYQKIKNDKTFRVELFYKEYKELLLMQNSDPTKLDNSGEGYAKGVDVFWRDRSSIKDIDYWISYSWIDTKRKFMNYPEKVQPNFVAEHTASLVVKRFFSSISTNIGFTYTYASGRPYYNPNRSEKEYMVDHTIDYHSVAFSAHYLTMIGRANTVFMLNVSNILGSQQIYGYNFSSMKNDQGLYASKAVMPTAKRFILIGMYMSLGVDRRKDIIDN